MDCKHFRYDFFTGKEFGKCLLFSKIEEKNDNYLVNGKKEKIYTDYEYCSIVRKYNKCGLDGKFFEKRNK
jgi:hypothetical protein